jgi:hypothetical protein
MRRVLVAAGIYNLIWGAFAVLFPGAMFSWLAMAPPNYPQLWQCIGMIVGVYGVGYLIAASDPARHWPIVLVGFLGKVFGPLGMVQALWTETLPWGFALNCLTNDVLWWFPFALILRHAGNEFLADRGDVELPPEGPLLAEIKTTLGSTLASLSASQPLLLVFLRHSGCTFCREALADLQRRRTEIERQGVRLALVHLGDPDAFARLTADYGLSDVPVVWDPERRLYRGLGLRRGSLAQLLGPKVWWRGAKAFWAGHGLGSLDGDGTQLAGVFLIQQGRVIRRHLHATAADRPDYVALSRRPEVS